MPFTADTLTYRSVMQDTEARRTICMPSDMTGKSVQASSEAEMSITTPQPVKPNSKGEAYSSTSV